MLMADEYKYVLILPELFGGDLPVWLQFTVLSAPIVKDHKRPFTRDGKTAVIIMGN